MARRGHLPLDTAVATAETLTYRLPVFWKAMLAPTPASSAAIAEMIVEKQVAFAHGVVAVQAELLRQAFRPWWLWTVSQRQSAANDLAHAALAPASRRVKTNARRLRRRHAHT
jgi:hypothetical protein